METFRIWAGAAVLLLAFLAIPLSGFAVSGSWRGAWRALKEYLIAMGVIVVPVLVLVVITLVMQLTDF